MFKSYQNIFFYFIIILINLFFFLIFFEIIIPKFTKIPHMVYRYWDNRPVTFHPNLLNRAITDSYDTYFRTN